MFTVKTRLTLLLLLLLTGTAYAQDAASPYAGDEARAVKALSPEEVAAYRAGEGMGLARAAELNHYPGPKHVLEMADTLDLNDAQRRQTQAAFEAMRAAAVPLGEKIVAREAALDALFAEGRAAAEPVRALLDEIGQLQAELRFAHLNAHLAMKAILSEHQVHRYDQLRGYAAGDAPMHHPGMHH